ncbi:hypothetical protein X801_05633 [Opisthorchis viverrini]|uniref:Uncharacterized protein n=1 Tax=Opisthorchis viverrini TaxID=6198 RepID=A0A1S8WVD8_OPIVI|nr:hypothetical protein X801_05633 [Opisthorchis viverrini]
MVDALSRLLLRGVPLRTPKPAELLMISYHCCGNTSINKEKSKTLTSASFLYILVAGECWTYTKRIL